MATITIELKGLEAVRQKFSREKLARVAAVTLRSLTQGALLIEGRAKRKAPVDMGRLRASITHEGPSEDRGRIESRVGTNVNYAKFVEFGTGPAGAESPLSETAREAMQELGYQHGPRGGWPPLEQIIAWATRKGIADPEGAAFLIQRHIRQRGTPAHPFLYPAFEESAEEIVRETAAAVKAEIEA